MLQEFINQLKESAEHRDILSHYHYLPEKPVEYAVGDAGLSPMVLGALERLGIPRLYSHQGEALAAIREGKNLLVATPTASGKTLIYNLPVLATMMAEREARALYLFPLKALEQDQLKALRELDGALPSPFVSAAIYDGDTPPAARQALTERGLATTDENVFLVASAIVAGKNMDLNEGIRLLTGKAKIVLPFKKKEATAAPAPAAAVATAAPVLAGPVTTKCTVVENGSSRNFTITIEPAAGSAKNTVGETPAPAASGNGTKVFSPFQGKTELVEINVKVGDTVRQGQVVAAVEAMKAKHDVKAPCAGTVVSIDAAIGADIEARHPILTLEA